MSSSSNDNGLPTHCAEQILYFIHQEGFLSVPELRTKIKYSITAIRNNMSKLRTLDMIEVSHKKSRLIYFKISKSEQLRMGRNKNHFLNHI